MNVNRDTDIYHSTANGKILVFNQPHAVQHGAIRPQSDDLISVCDCVFESVFNTREVSIWYPDKLEHFRIKSQPLAVFCMVVS